VTGVQTCALPIYAGQPETRLGSFGLVAVGNHSPRPTRGPHAEQLAIGRGQRDRFGLVRPATVALDVLQQAEEVGSVLLGTGGLASGTARQRWPPASPERGNAETTVGSNRR